MEKSKRKKIFKKTILILYILLIGGFFVSQFFYFIQILNSIHSPRFIKDIQLLYSYCTSNGEANIVIMNAGIEPLNIGSIIDCGNPGSITGDTKTCGDIIIRKTEGGMLNGSLGNSTVRLLEPRAYVFLNDKCGNGITCTYRISVKNISIRDVVALVYC